MNGEQAKILGRAVQWAIDEAAGIRGEIAWDQSTWFQGRVAGAAFEVPVDLGWSSPGETAKVVELDCGTSCCIAGNIVLSAGEKIVSYVTLPPPLAGEVRWGTMVLHEGTAYEVSARAADILGVEVLDVHMLFAGDNDIASVIEYASELASTYGHQLHLEIHPVVADMVKARA